MSVTMRQMLEAGVHFGHQTRYWNPKMAPYIFGHRNKIHIINLEKTLAHVPGRAASSCASWPPTSGTILFVGTKRQAREIMREEAQRCRHALRRSPLARRHADQLQDGQAVDQAPEGNGTAWPRTARSSACRRRKRSASQRELAKLQRSLGGIKDMNGLPDALFVIDVGYQKGAVPEANKLGIPVVGVVDTNHSPDGDRPTSSRATTIRAAPSACTRAAWPMRCWKARCRRWRTWCRPSPAATSSSKWTKVEDITRRCTEGWQKRGASPFFAIRQVATDCRSCEWRKSPQPW